MLSVFASQTIQPEAEAIDRDPGIITLAAGLVRALRRAVPDTAARLRGYNQRVDEAESFRAANAWPRNHRSN